LWAKFGENMAEVSGVEWFNTLVGKQVFFHNTKDGHPDNDKKQPEAESQVKHLTEI